MIEKNHYITIVVNDSEVELFSQDRLNLRINNTLLDVSEILSKTTEYSFSFELPTSPNNCRIFGFANDLSTIGKYSKQYSCIVYADGYEIFTGTLRLAAVTYDSFKCNLVSVKLNKVEDIFKTSTMSELRWEVPFTGADTINSVNSDMTSDYYFPLVCYGAFQKKPEVEMNNYVRYTDLHTIDSTNRWYWETFHPSFRLTALIKRLFELKGYNVQGDIFDDPIASNIYISESLKDKQDPTYNIGASNIGDLELAFNFTNKWVDGSFTISANYWALNQDPTYKHDFIARNGDSEYYRVEGLYNYDLFSFGNTSSSIYGRGFTWTTRPTNPYLYRDENDGAGYIVIPADGMYAIEMDATFDMSDTVQSSPYVKPYIYTWDTENSDYTQKETTVYKNFDTCPVELHLVRNKHEVEWIWGADTDNSVYPHEAGEIRKGAAVRTGHFSYGYTGSGEMYTVKNGQTVAYDPKVNPNFICGMSTKSNSLSYIKNGMSWDLETTDENISRYIGDGYWKISKSYNGTSSTTTWDKTDYNSNTLRTTGGTTPYFSSTGTYKRAGKLKQLVYLKKNDVLMLKAVTRRFTSYVADDGSYESYDDVRFSMSCNLKIHPWSPSYDRWFNLNLTPNFDNSSDDTKKFDQNLNLGNFLKSDEKMSDFVQNFIKAFNLSYRQNGNNIYLNKMKFDTSLSSAFVDIDDRVNSNNAESSRLEYPASIQVKFAIDDSEAGFYSSVPDTHINDDDWKNWADTGSEKIPLVEDETANDEELELKQSYCWYQDFKWLIGTVYPGTITLPVIAKDEDFIIQSEKSMKKDGLGLKQRWWFRQEPGVLSVTLWNNTNVFLSIPTNEKNGYVINYKDEPGSMLRQFFNITSMPDSNMVTIEVALTPAEYIQLKNGAMVKFDSDLYYVAEISGYDPTGNNLTELHLIKKV